MMSLPTNYQNEILNPSMSNRRQYRLVENNNGTYSFIDVTVYDREGSLFDADDINNICQSINDTYSLLDILNERTENGIVNGVKGSAENNYRQGRVNLTPGDIGTYSQQEIRDLISAIGGMHFEVVDVLPTTNISTSAIYLVPSTNPKQKNVKDEYIYVIESDYTEITNQCEIVYTFEDLPAEGVEGTYYITYYDLKVYEWSDTNSEYAQSEDYPVLLQVNSLPDIGSESVLYITLNDEKIYYCENTSDWEIIGSTSVNLDNYYTKTEIDTGALITVAEFENLT